MAGAKDINYYNYLIIGCRLTWNNKDIFSKVSNPSYLVVVFVLKYNINPPFVISIISFVYLTGREREKGAVLFLHFISQVKNLLQVIL